jgi:hypothetical protein
MAEEVARLAMPRHGRTEVIMSAGIHPAWAAVPHTARVSRWRPLEVSR